MVEDDLDNTHLLENILTKKEHTVEVFPDVGKPCRGGVIKKRYDFDQMDYAANGWDYFNLSRAHGDLVCALNLVDHTSIIGENARPTVTGRGCGRFSDKTIPVDVVRVLSDGFVCLNQPPSEADDRIVTPVRVKEIPSFVSVMVAAGAGAPSNIDQFY